MGLNDCMVDVVADKVKVNIEKTVTFLVQIEQRSESI